MMTVMDGGAPFDLDYEPLTESAKWLHENRGGRGQIHIIPNSHAIGRTRVGLVVFLTKIDVDELVKQIQLSIEKGDDFDQFRSGFGLSND